ncbi:unnamed protein product [Oppiella nova]|uniref:Gem-associated protein 2 n=1 Tax=Oppiella nova TaxID=334625 RepID=A0A7R9MDS9_9ACAR|nr:unnamed protein product [Oppiella nova]CAG2174313.1 unnamed protein product [Oppiella nova]
MNCYTEDFEEYHEEEASDDDYGDQLDRILVPKLPVANFDHYDPSRPPVTGEEYLRRVQLEAQKCPEVVVANLDVNQFTPNQTLIIENSNGFIRAKPESTPSVDWQRAQVSEFSHVRTSLARMRAHRPPGTAVDPIADRPPVRHRSMSWWRDYCIGKRSDHSSDSDSDRGGGGGDEDESDLSTPTDTPHNSSALKREKRAKRESNLPLMSTICALTQDEVIVLLSFYAKWCQQYRFTEHFGLWIYALLVALEKPLPAEVYSTLRDLSRVCSECRHKIGSDCDSNVLISLNLIICIIGRYFDQNDMCDQ